MSEGLDGLIVEDAAPANDTGVVDGGGEKAPEALSPKEAAADAAMIQQELEAKAAEVEQLRALTDKLLSIAGKTPDSGDDEDTDPIEEFEKDPEGYIKRVVDSDPRVKKAEELESQFKAERALGELREQVEDFEDILKSTEFSGWLKENPVYARVLETANASYDAAGVAGVLKHFKEVIQRPEGEDGKERRNPLHAGKKGGGASKGGPVFSREALRKLAAEDPLRYQKLQPEIMRAYKEGRVK